MVASGPSERATRKRWIEVSAAAATILATVTAILVNPTAAHAATLTQVSSFGSNPSNLQMLSYRPDGVAAGAPVVLALHGCSQNAEGYYTNSGWKKFADLYKFVVVFPQQPPANDGAKCFNWEWMGDPIRGQGGALSIRQMVSHAVSEYGADPERVYITGLSGGGVLTSVMLASYPDLFDAGSIVAGIPYGCAPETSPFRMHVYRGRQVTGSMGERGPRCFPRICRAVSAGGDLAWHRRPHRRDSQRDRVA